MNKEQLINIIKEIEPSVLVAETKQFLTITVSADKLYALANKLKNDTQLSFDYMFCITGSDQTDKIGVIYHLESTTLNHQLVVKCWCDDRNNATLPTVCDIWKTAEFHEREIYDLLGIRFTNHPDLRRIFLDETWVGHPLRKDYIDEINIIER